MILPYRATIAALLVAFALAPAASAQAQGEARSLQGGDTSAWTDNPNMHAFYDLTVATLGKGAANIDFATYQQKAYALFRAFGESMIGNSKGGDAMVEHLKDIPRQLVGIVKDDPKVLDSYKNFTLALMGPP